MKTQDKTNHFVVWEFISSNPYWFNDRNNGFFGMQKKIAATLKRFIKTGQYPKNYTMYYAVQKFEEYIEGK